MSKKVIDATKPLSFEITSEDIKQAKRKCPNNCVVAQAISRSFGDLDYEMVHVGLKITKIVTPTKVIRYLTPSALRRALPIFDATGEWKLPLGKYKLEVLPPSERLGARSNRANTWFKPKNSSGTGRVTFTGDERRLTARRIERVEAYAR